MSSKWVYRRRRPLIGPQCTRSHSMMASLIGPRRERMVRPIQMMGTTKLSRISCDYLVVTIGMTSYGDSTKKDFTFTCLQPTTIHLLKSGRCSKRNPGRRSRNGQQVCCPMVSGRSRSPPMIFSLLDRTLFSLSRSALSLGRGATR